MRAEDGASGNGIRPAGVGVLATESIVVKIRWFGIVMGVLLVQTRSGLHDPVAVRACLALGALYAALDTLAYRRGTVFLQRWPLFVSAMEATFIALLCYHDTQLASPFRWYYLLSIICCTIRYDRVVAWMTCGLHCLSFTLLAGLLDPRLAASAPVAEIVVIFACVTWASSSLALVLRSTGARLERLNTALHQHRGELEARVLERTAALRASQARVLHQEKMAAFGLLAAGIAHEVGNPLAGISSLIQMIRRRDPAPPTPTPNSHLAESQLARIQRTIRDLIDFSRPASTIRGRFRVADVVDEALGDRQVLSADCRARHHHGPRGRPPVRLRRPRPPHAGDPEPRSERHRCDRQGGGGSRSPGPEAADGVVLAVSDDGRGIAPTDQARVFQPYFTTKPQGTGLGLFVCRQIVSEMGGNLWFESTGGQGTTFHVTIPADRVGSHPVAALPASRTAPALAPLALIEATR